MRPPSLSRPVALLALFVLIGRAPLAAAQSLPPLPAPPDERVVHSLPPSSSPEPPSARTIDVHVVGPRAVALQLEEGDGTFTEVCRAPCDLALPAGAIYRVGGPGIALSRPFVLDANEEIVLIVSPSAKVGGGPIAIVFGALAFVGGVGLATMAVASPSSQDACACSENGAFDYGVVMASLGALVALAGVGSTVSNETTVRLSRDGASPEEPLLTHPMRRASGPPRAIAMFGGETESAPRPAAGGVTATLFRVSF